MYRNARDGQNVSDLGERLGNPNYEAIGLVLKAYCLQYLTEMYGDVPYTNALDGKTDGEFQPSYTPQAEVYQGLLADYATAADLPTSDHFVVSRLAPKIIVFVASMVALVCLNSKGNRMGVGVASRLGPDCNPARG